MSQINTSLNISVEQVVLFFHIHLTSEENLLGALTADIEGLKSWEKFFSTNVLNNLSAVNAQRIDYSCLCCQGGQSN